MSNNIPDNDPRVSMREVVSVAEDGAGYTVELSCKHTVWTAIKFAYPVVCAQCINDLLDQVNCRGKYALDAGEGDRPTGR